MDLGGNGMPVRLNKNEFRLKATMKRNLLIALARRLRCDLHWALLAITLNNCWQTYLVTSNGELLVV